MRPPDRDGAAEGPNPAGPGSSVTVTTTWTGAGGVKGFFEKTFAPLGLKRIQGEMLANLKKELES